MRPGYLFLLLPLLAGAQLSPPELTGVLLECDSGVASGQFAVRAPDDQVFRFQFDARTTVERDTLHGGVSRLAAGDKVLVESEAVAGSLLRYAASVKVLTPRPPISLADSSLRHPERLFQVPQTASLTFSGVIAKLNPESLVLRTRVGEQTLLIRRDTRYVSNGDTVGLAALQPNMRVFIRAGKNIYEQVEAYQVIWGSILDPKR